MDAFERIMNRLSDADPGVVEKTAAVQEVSDASARMLAKVRELSDGVSKTAEAAPASPTEDLQRMAKEAAALENEVLVEEAQFLGSAIADGFMQRFASYDTALAQAGIKTASTPSPELLKQAQEQAYRQGQADLQKQAEAAYEQGYNEQMSEIHKVASDIHMAGQCAAREIVRHNSAK